MIAKVKGYFLGAKQEFKSIHWPSYAETRSLTLVVVFMSLVVAVYLGVFDYFFSYVLGLVLNFI